jgi:hypothetical protein
MRSFDDIGKCAFAEYLGSAAIDALLFVVWHCHPINGAAIAIGAYL